MKKLDIKSMNTEELTEALKAMGEPKFRASQIFDWLHVKKVKSFAEMTNLSKALISKLEEEFFITALEIEKGFSQKSTER